jgi:ABC-type sugar transport system ATPase subunit
MTRLELRHVRKRFGELDVLADISLTVGAGEFVSILARRAPENRPSSSF